MQVKPSKLDKDQALNVLKVALWVGASAAISYVITFVTDNPDLFGPLTPIINVVLVTLKNVFTPTK